MAANRLGHPMVKPSPFQTVRATVLLERRSLKALLDLLKPSVVLSIEEVTPAGWTRRVPVKGKP